MQTKIKLFARWDRYSPKEFFRQFLQPNLFFNWCFCPFLQEKDFWKELYKKELNWTELKINFSTTTVLAIVGTPNYLFLLTSLPFVKLFTVILAPNFYSTWKQPEFNSSELEKFLGELIKSRNSWFWDPCFSAKDYSLYWDIVYQCFRRYPSVINDLS